MSRPNSPEAFVRAVVAQADRRRRARATIRRIAALAPVVTGVTALAALLLRLTGAPSLVPLGLLVAALVGLAAVTWTSLRTRTVADGDAAAIDRDAALGGELRSANWFANATSRDAWADYHLEQAADRVQGVEWSTVYPRYRAGRAWAATAVLAAATVAMSIVIPPRHLAAETPAGGPAVGARPEFAELPDELKKRLQMMLDKMNEAQFADKNAIANAADLAELLAKLDPELSAKLAKMAKDLADKQALDAKAGKKASGDDMASNAGLPEDVRWALKDLASRLADAKGLDRQTNADNPSASQESGETGRGSEQAGMNQMTSAQAAMQMVRESAADAQMNQMMMGGGGMGGDSRSGAGGNSGVKPGDIDASLLAVALKKELVEASADMLGSNVSTEDIRRKTEASQSTLGFTRVAPPAAGERSRALAPPPVPEARLDLVQRYFIRK